LCQARRFARVRIGWSGYGRKLPLNQDNSKHFLLLDLSSEGSSIRCGAALRWLVHREVVLVTTSWRVLSGTSSEASILAVHRFDLTSNK